MSVPAKHLIDHEERAAEALYVVRPRQVRDTGLGIGSMMLAGVFVLAECTWLGFLGYLAIRYAF